MVAYIIMAIIAYAIGSINFSVIISKKMAGFDVREKGSGNAGSTNVLRTVGKKAAIITLICDILKGVISVLIALLVGKIAGESVNSAIVVEIAALAVVIGHTFPIFFGFRGGKGVATSLGVILVVNWKIGLICLVFALALMALTRMVSLGSISASVLFVSFALMILTQFTKGGQKRKNTIYRICGWTMVVVMVLVVVGRFFPHPPYMTMIYEFILLEAFAVAWIVKSGAFQTKEGV